MYNYIMTKTEVFPTNPIENIAEVVRRQFREQVQKDMTASSKKAKISKMDDVEVALIARDDRMQSRRRVQNNVISAQPSDGDEIQSPTADEQESQSSLELGASIYDDLPDGTPGEEPLSPEEAALQIALAVRKGHEKGKPDIDWFLVKSLYVHGGWTYERIANECNVAFSLVRLNGRKGRWPEARESYRAEQAQKVQERLALEEDRLREWQILKRRQAGIDGLNWITKAVANLGDTPSPEAIAKLAPILDRLLSSVTGLAPVEGTPGGVSVNVSNNNVAVSNYASNSPQAKLAAVWDKKIGETDEDHTRRLALTIRDLYLECERAGLYEDLKLDPESQRQMRLKNRLGIAEPAEPIMIAQ